MNIALIINFVVFSFVSLVIILFGTNTYSKAWGIPFGMLAIYNLFTYLQLVFPTINWI